MADTIDSTKRSFLKHASLVPALALLPGVAMAAQSPLADVARAAMAKGYEGIHVVNAIGSALVHTPPSHETPLKREIADWCIEEENRAITLGVSRELRTQLAGEYGA